MKVIIAEKPSVAREIALSVGAAQKNDGYYHGNEYTVTWALGHLVVPAMPETYGCKGFNAESLPVIPNPFQLIVRQIKVAKRYKTDPGAMAQLKVIRKLFDKCDSIIVATDAGREGELIFRYIYEHLGCTKPFDRLWISSLTDKAIREGLENLKSGSDYDNLYVAAKARSEADWLIGINATRAVSIAAKHGTYSIGRVQTPTLCMITSRFLENRKFTPQPFWQLGLVVSRGKESLKVVSEQKWEANIRAVELFNSVRRVTCAVVEGAQVQELIQDPPLLYDLTTLQREANTRHGFSADKTLSIAQRLYEAKLITYPRTGSRYISDDVFEQFPAMFPKLPIKNRRSVDSSRVTDHHALLTIGRKSTALSADEASVFDMISQRLYEAFAQPCIKQVTTYTVSCCDTIFTAKSTSIKQLGWKSIAPNEPTEDVMPNWSEGQTLKIEGCSLIEEATKPAPLLTESSLLSAMENSGLGTPATRAAIIETLITREYIVRKERSLIPTEKGVALYYIVRDMRVGNAEMTGEWEAALAKIERGEMAAQTFRKSIEIYTRQITAELFVAKIYASK